VFAYSPFKIMAGFKRNSMLFFTFLLGEPGEINFLEDIILYMGI
jgi:hypothetical protein